MLSGYIFLTPLFQWTYHVYIHTHTHTHTYLCQMCVCIWTDMPTLISNIYQNISRLMCLSVSMYFVFTYIWITSFCKNIISSGNIWVCISVLVCVRVCVCVCVYMHVQRNQYKPDMFTLTSEHLTAITLDWNFVYRKCWFYVEAWVSDSDIHLSYTEKKLFYLYIFYSVFSVPLYMFRYI